MKRLLNEAEKEAAALRNVAYLLASMPIVVAGTLLGIHWIIDRFM